MVKNVSIYQLTMKFRNQPLEFKDSEGSLKSILSDQRKDHKTKSHGFYNEVASG